MKWDKVKIEKYCTIMFSMLLSMLKTFLFVYKMYMLT